MSKRPLRRTRAHLDDVLAGRAPAGDPLVDLVAAAQAPAQPGELAGLDAAVAAFAAATVAAEGAGTTPLAAAPARPGVVKGIATRLLALKVLAITAATAAAGGVAYAAVDGHLPGTGSPHRSPSSASAPARSESRPGSGARSFEPGSDEVPTLPGGGPGSGLSLGRSGGNPTRGSVGPAIPPSLHGLCTAWLAHRGDVGALATTPAFQVLIAAAGGPAAVDAYCTAGPVRPTGTPKPSKPAPPQSNRSHTKPAPPQSNRSHTKTKKPKPSKPASSKSHKPKPVKPGKPNPKPKH